MFNICVLVSKCLRKIISSNKSLNKLILCDVKTKGGRVKFVVVTRLLLGGVIGQKNFAWKFVLGDIF